MPLLRLGFRVYGFRVWGLGFWFRVWASGFRGLGDSGFRFERNWASGLLGGGV